MLETWRAKIQYNFVADYVIDISWEEEQTDNCCWELAFENASTPFRMSLFACQFKQCIMIDYHFHVPTV